MNPLEQGPEPNIEILAVEDSPTQAAKLRAVLEAEGYTVNMAPTGKQALAMLNLRKPSLVITDVVMPEMNGFALCKEIKSQERLRDLPVILMTSLSSPRDILMGLECGADNFIRKPYEDKVLLTRIQSLLLNRTLRKTERTQIGMEIYVAGQRYFITSEQHQVLDLLISTYEDAVHLNEELQVKQNQLAELAQELEKKVEERTAGLKTETAERFRAQEMLRESEARFRRLAESNIIGLCVADSHGQIVEANAAFLNMVQYSEEDLRAGRVRWDRMTPPEFQAVNARIQQQLRTSGVTAPAETEYIRKDGGRVPALVGLAALDAQANQAIGFVIDLTDRKSLERQLRQAQKMEAVGQLAGGVAHDFNNLLTIILGYGQILQDTVGSQGKEYVTEILKASEQAASLTRQLLAFSRQQIMAPQVLDLNRIVSSAEKMLKRLIGEDINLTTIQGQDLGPVKADPGQIEQVILNLAVNARDAMPEGGMLTIETANVDLGEAYAGTHPPVIPGPYVMLAVSDTGIGMDAETQTHVFEPFFTTKEAGKGTGLGLSTVYGIIKQSGGYIWVYGEAGRGTSFKVYLPRVQDRPTAVESATAEPESVQGTETVLVVEDEESVRSLVLATLESHGYKVLEAPSAEDALETCKGYRDPIQLLVTDVIMPQMNGKELAKQLTSLHPETEVLYMSGYTANAIARHGVLDAGIFFLQKPFTLKALLRKVRDVLDAKRKND